MSPIHSATKHTSQPYPTRNRRRKDLSPRKYQNINAKVLPHSTEGESLANSHVVTCFDDDFYPPNEFSLKKADSDEWVNMFANYLNH